MNTLKCVFAIFSAIREVQRLYNGLKAHIASRRENMDFVQYLKKITFDFECCVVFSKKIVIHFLRFLKIEICDEEPSQKERSLEFSKNEIEHRQAL